MASRHRAGPAEAAVVRDREGEKRTVFELDVDEVGPSLRNATAKVTKTTVQAAVAAASAAAQPAGGDDPWSTPQAGGGRRSGDRGHGWQGRPWADTGGGSLDEPPF